MPEYRFRNRGLSDNTLAAYGTAVRQYKAFLADNGLSNSPESVVLFGEAIRCIYKPTSYNQKLQAVKEFLLAGLEADYIQIYKTEQYLKQALPKVSIKTSVSRDRYIEKDELDILCHNLESEGRSGIRVSLLIQALFWSALRISELLRVKHENSIRIPNAVAIDIVGKRNKQHRTYLPVDLYERINASYIGRLYLFETRTGNRYHRTTATKMIKTRVAKYGYSLSAHEIGRHSRAVHLKSIGLSPDKIAKALNHSSVKTTLESYFHGEPTIEELGIGS